MDTWEVFMAKQLWWEFLSVLKVSQLCPSSRYLPGGVRRQVLSTA